MLNVQLLGHVTSLSSCAQELGAWEQFNPTKAANKNGRSLRVGEVTSAFPGGAGMFSS